MTRMGMLESTAPANAMGRYLPEVPAFNCPNKTCNVILFLLVR